MPCCTYAPLSTNSTCRHAHALQCSAVASKCNQQRIAALKHDTSNWGRLAADRLLSTCPPLCLNAGAVSHHAVLSVKQTDHPTKTGALLTLHNPKSLMQSSWKPLPKRLYLRHLKQQSPVSWMLLIFLLHLLSLLRTNCRYTCSCFIFLLALHALVSTHACGFQSHAVTIAQLLFGGHMCSSDQ